MNILLTTDGSKYSEGAAKFLTRLNFSSDDEINILHVISKVPSKGDSKSSSSKLRQQQEMTYKIIETVRNIVKPLNTKINTTVVKHGHPDKGIIDVAENLNTDMIVMGPRGLTGLKSIFIGSVTKSVAINTSKPMLIVKPHQWEASDKLKILFATDGSYESVETGKLLCLIPFHKDTEVNILNIISSSMSIPERIHMEIDERIKKISADAMTKEFDTSQKVIKQAQELLCDRFRKINGLTKIGDPSIEIANTAQALKIDIAAVGSKGMKGIKSMLGSVSRHILNHSECSVLIGRI